jgi:hypothetical protein
MRTVTIPEQDVSVSLTELVDTILGNELEEEVRAALRDATYQELHGVLSKLAEELGIEWEEGPVPVGRHVVVHMRAGVVYEGGLHGADESAIVVRVGPNELTRLLWSNVRKVEL